MIDPARHRQLEELDMVNLCTQILVNARNELYLSMHFLDIALSSFGFQADPSVGTVGTDGNIIYYNPESLCSLYRRGRVYVNRAYLHMVFHCLFCHPDTRGKRVQEYWNLACDIAMESVIDSLYKKCVHAASHPFRRETYLRLGKQMKVLTAERIYQALQEWNLSKQQYERLAAEFLVDDHSIWYKENPKSQMIPRQGNWKDTREKMQAAMEAMGRRQAGAEDESSLLEQIRIENRERYDFRRFLKKFSVLKEEIRIDEDSFDYIYYTYGLKHYGNMPLIEPLESKEVFRVEDFVIAIDTSMSCSGELVRHFLEETLSILRESESFFRKVNIHIIQCDDMVRSDMVITNLQQMKEYMEHFTVKGKGGTDFRPVFEYVSSLCAQGKFTKLRGLLYFTDGEGIYPVKAPAYDTAFIFIEDPSKDRYQEAEVPSWAMKLVLGAEDLDLPEGIQGKQKGVKAV